MEMRSWQSPPFSDIGLILSYGPSGFDDGVISYGQRQRFLCSGRPCEIEQSGACCKKEHLRGHFFREVLLAAEKETSCPYLFPGITGVFGTIQEDQAASLILMDSVPVLIHIVIVIRLCKESDHSSHDSFVSKPCPEKEIEREHGFCGRVARSKYSSIYTTEVLGKG
jgi:hypothetical protein